MLSWFWSNKNALVACPQVQVYNPNDRTAGWEARAECFYGHDECLAKMKLKENPTCLTPALVVAGRKNQNLCAKVLIENGADAADGDENNTPIATAFDSGSVQTFNLMVDMTDGEKLKKLPPRAINQQIKQKIAEAKKKAAEAPKKEEEPKKEDEPKKEEKKEEPKKEEKK